MEKKGETQNVSLFLKNVPSTIALVDSTLFTEKSFLTFKELIFPTFTSYNNVNTVFSPIRAGSQISATL